MAPWFGLGGGELKEEGGYINYHEDIELAYTHSMLWFESGHEINGSDEYIE